MIKRVTTILLLSTLLFVVVACSGNEFKVSAVVSYPYYDVKTSSMGLAVYVKSDSDKNQSVSFEIKNPDGSLTWTVNATSLPFDDGRYFGSSDIKMPTTRLLDTGKWTLTVISNDGSAEEFKFDVHYIYGLPAADKKTSYFDSEKNLTFVF